MIRPFLFNFDDYSEVRKFKSIIESMIGEIASCNADLAMEYVKKLRMVASDDDFECEEIVLFLKEKRDDERIRECEELVKKENREFFKQLNDYMKEDMQ